MKLIIELPEGSKELINENTWVAGSLFDGVVRLALQHSIPYEERPHGEWITHSNEGSLWRNECPICHERSSHDANFCQYCGAEMRRNSVRPDTLGCFNCKHSGKRVTAAPCITCGEEFKNWVDFQEEDNDRK